MIMKMIMKIDIHIIDLPLFTVLLGRNRSVDVVVLEASGFILRIITIRSLTHSTLNTTLCIIAYLSTLALRLLALLLLLLLLRGLNPVDRVGILVRSLVSFVCFVSLRLLGLFLCRRLLELAVLAGGTDGGVWSGHGVVLRMSEF